jgi:hypothetical protein
VGLFTHFDLEVHGKAFFDFFSEIDFENRSMGWVSHWQTLPR